MIAWNRSDVYEIKWPTLESNSQAWTIIWTSMLQEDQINHELCKICLATVCFSDTLLKNLERIQFRALRKITGKTLNTHVKLFYWKRRLDCLNDTNYTAFMTRCDQRKNERFIGKNQRRNIISYHHKCLNFIDLG